MPDQGGGGPLNGIASGLSLPVAGRDIGFGLGRA